MAMGSVTLPHASTMERQRDSYILSLTNFKDLKIYENNNTVAFSGGWDLVELISSLHNTGFHVHNLGSKKVQNYIRASTTSTHSTGKQKNLANQIIGLHVMDTQKNSRH
jgi:hypothetical protein